MIATNANAATLLDRAVGVHHVSGRPTAHVDDQRAEILLIVVEHDLRAGQRAEDDVLDFDAEFFHAADARLDAASDPMDNVEIRLQHLSEHANWIQYAILAVDIVVLEDGVQELIGLRNANLPRSGLHIFEIVFADLFAILRDLDGSAIVEALDVPSRDREDLRS